MTMSNMRQDRENDKFVETTEGATAVRVVVDNEAAPLLPTGAATEAKQDAGNASLVSILGAVDQLEGYTDGIESALSTLNGKDFSTETTLSSLNSKVPSNLTVTSTRLLVDGSGVTQPVSGTVTVDGTMGASYYTEGDIDTTVSGVALLSEDTATSTMRTVQTKQLATQVTGTDYGVIVNATIHGLTTAGGGGFVDLKVNPSGSLEVGTVASVTTITNPVAVTGTFWQTTQPVSGTVTANQGGTWNITNISGTVSLPTGAATETTLSALNTKVPSGLTVTSTRLLVDGSGVTQPVSGTVSVSGSVAVTGPLTDTQLRATAVPISIAATVATREVQSATGTLSNVAGSVTSVTLLASNASRLGAAFYNDSTSICYVKHGSTASATSFTVKMYPEDYYEIPYGYTGIVTGIWVSATGSMRVTEQT